MDLRDFCMLRHVGRRVKHFTVGSIAQVAEVILAAVIQVEGIRPLTSFCSASLHHLTFSPVEVVAEPTNPSLLPAHRSSPADPIPPIVESGCLEWTAAATCLIPPLADKIPRCWYGEKPGADAVGVVSGKTAKPWVGVVASDPVVSSAVVLIEESEIDSGNRGYC